MSQLARLLRPALLAFALLVPLQAQAFQITVSGVTYDLAVVTTTFNASSVLLQSQPWYTGTPDDVPANTFVNAFVFAGGDTTTDLGGGLAYFAYDAATTFGVVENARANGTANAGTAPTNAFFPFVYVTATVVPVAAVPEIDGNALPKALFILFTLWLWLQVRRGRRVAGPGAVG